jgi:two-component system KDP operon response regulator KdpE
MAAVFIVEDDQSIRDLASKSLTDTGNTVRAASTAMESLQAIVDSPPDVVVLDLGLPDLDGVDLLRMIRAVSDVPIIVATARDHEDDVVRVLDAGADEYVVKPYTGPELAARIRALLRRLEADDGGDVLVISGLRIDTKSREVSLDGRSIDLNRKEFDILAHLAQRPGEVVTRRDLFAEVWRQPYGGADRTIDVHISWIRRKLGESAAEPRYLHTVRGVGMKLLTPE